MSARLQIPAFDPDSPDAMILDAYEQMRRLKAESYRRDRLNDWPDDTAADAAGNHILDIEKRVTSNWAATPAGVVSRLLVLIPELDNERWIDEALTEHGLLSLTWDCQRIDGHAQQVRFAALELISIEWQRAHDDYERARQDFNLAL